MCGLFMGDRLDRNLILDSYITSILSDKTKRVGKPEPDRSLIQQADQIFRVLITNNYPTA